MELVWRLMRLETFSCVSTNLLRNNIPDQVLVHHDKVNIRNSSVESFHLSLLQVFSLILEHCRKLENEKGVSEAKRELQKLFKYLEETELYISRYIAEEIQRYLGRGEVEVSFVFSTNNDYAGKCRNCGGELAKYKLKEEDRMRLIKVRAPNDPSVLTITEKATTG